MKPALFKYINENGAIFIEDEDMDVKAGVTKIPLYAIPDGYRLLPIEPPQDTLAEYRHYYKAILEAAPKIENI